MSKVRLGRLAVVLLLGSLLLLTMLFPGGGARGEDVSSLEMVQVLVTFTQPPGSQEEALITDIGGQVLRRYSIVPTLEALVPRGGVDTLKSKPEVKAVEEDIIVGVVAQVLPWGVDRVDAELVHPQYQGLGVKVAILDTGIDLTHPDLQAAGVVSFVAGAPSGQDDHGHGTVVAGVVAALNNEIGVVGVAPQVQLYSVKVLNYMGSGFSSDILAGIEWSTANGMQVINMSFGSVLEFPLAVQDALRTAYQAGIVLVAGAGNEGDIGRLLTPARYDSVIAVGATDSLDARASFSSTGDTLEVMAPGVDILTTTLGGGYGLAGGTSLSAPHVTGMAALLISSGITDNTLVRQYLRNTALDLGAAGWDRYYGFGLANAHRAIYPLLYGLTDILSPITAIQLSGTAGAQGWFRSSVQVQLSATDGGSGVASTEYSLDKGLTYQPYQGPFVFSQEGTSNVWARSWDLAGNMEFPPVKTQVKIDLTPPTVAVSASPSTLSPQRPGAMADVAITGSAQEGAGQSGVETGYGRVEDEYNLVEPSFVGLTAIVQLEAWRQGSDQDGRTYTIFFTARDYAGNTATATTVVLVPHDRGQ